MCYILYMTTIFFKILNLLNNKNFFKKCQLPIQIINVFLY